MTEVSHEIKIPVAEPDSKGTLAKGKGVTEAVVKERKPVILSETPGRDISIKPRSPYREFKGENWNRSSSDRSSEESVRVNDNKIRSVYEIRGSKDHHYGSPNHSTPNYNHHVFSGNTPNLITSSRSSHQRIPPGAVPYYYPQGIPPGAIVGSSHHVPMSSSTAYATPQYGSFPPPPYHYPTTPMGTMALAPNAMPDYDSYPEELEKEARLKFKSLFSALKIKYPDKDFSEYDPDMPLRYIHQTYLDYKRNIAIESNASILKVVLVFIFFAFDFVCRKYLGFDSSSFTKTQLARFKSYEGVINEISASFVGNGDNDWPVGIRFAFLLIFQGGLFVGVSFLCSKMGIKDPQGMLDLANGIVGNSVDEVVTAKPSQPVDPVTNTTEVLKADPVRNLMGNAQTLLAMAGSALGTNTGSNGDVGDAIGNIGATILANNVKAKKPTVRFGTKK